MSPFGYLDVNFERIGDGPGKSRVLATGSHADGACFLIHVCDIDRIIRPVEFTLGAVSVGRVAVIAIVPHVDLVGVREVEVGCGEIDCAGRDSVQSCVGQGTSSEVEIALVIFDAVGKVLQVGGGDGHLAGVDLEHIEVLVGDAREHGNQDTD